MEIKLSDYAVESSALGVKFEEIQVPVPWGHICGKWWGCRDAVPLVGLHGFLDSAGSFDRVAPLLDVPAFLALDFPGHGRSSHLPRGARYQFTDFILSVRYVVEHFGWKKVSIVGHSFGSAVGVIYAASYPEQVHSLVSLDCGRYVIPLLHAKGPPLVRGVVDLTIKHERSRLEDSPAYQWDDLVASYSKATILEPAEAEHIVLILARSVIPHPKVEGSICVMKDLRLGYKLGILGFPNFDQQLECLQEVKCHVMEVQGSEWRNLMQALRGGPDDDTAEKQRNEHSALLRESAASYELVEFTGIHHLHLSSPEGVASVINNFLRRTKEHQEALLISRL